MRSNASVSIFIALSLSSLLTACASTPAAPPPKIVRVGSLQVHPDLINPSGHPTVVDLPEPVPVAANPVVERKEISPDPALRARRSIYFDYRASEIKEEFAAVLKAHAEYLARHPKARVRLEGNTDERASSSYNLRLALQRADAVRHALLEQGAQSQQIRVVSLGAINPRDEGHDEDSWAKNRRTDIVYE